MTAHTTRRAGATSRIHPGDAALLRTACALASSDETLIQGEAEEALRVLDTTLADAGWQAHGTPGLVALLGTVVAGAYSDDSWKGWDEVHHLIERSTEFCLARGMTDTNRRQGLARGLAVLAAWARTEDAAPGMAKASVDSGEGMMGAVFSPLTGRAVREILEEALGLARSGADRLALARGGLCGMACLLDGGDVAWRPGPLCVAWLAGGLASSGHAGIANRIHEEACAISMQEKDGAGCALERLLDICTREITGWDEPQAALFQREWTRARRAARSTGRGLTSGAMAVLYPEDVEWVDGALNDALAMRRAAAALARFDGGARKKVRARG